jgi:hypothetical protein
MDPCSTCCGYCAEWAISGVNHLLELVFQVCLSVGGYYIADRVMVDV